MTWNWERLKSEVLDKHQGLFQIVPSVKTKWKDPTWTYNGTQGPPEYRLRTVLSDEIIIELDGEPDENEKNLADVIKRLHGVYSFHVYYHGGRSQHIHIYNIVGLRALGFEKRKQYKKLFLKKYAPYESVDTTLTGDHLVALEFAPHFKHESVKKNIAYYNATTNHLEEELLKKLNYSRPIEQEMVDDVRGMWLLKFLTAGRLKKGARDLLLYKNAVILIKNRGLNPGYWFKRIASAQDDDAEAMSALSGWLSWAESRPVRFLSWEVERYCEVFGYDYKKVVDEDYRVVSELLGVPE